MPEPDDQVDVKALQQQLVELQPLVAEVAALKLDVAKGADGLKLVTAARDALQTKIPAYDKQVADLTKQLTDSTPYKDSHTKLLGTFTSRVSASLKASGMTDELLKDKSLDQLLAMEDALQAAKGSKGTTDTKGLGMGSGSGTNTTSSTNELDHGREIIKNAKRRAGIPV